MPEISFTTDNKQGAIPAGFPITLNGDYIVLTGENNAGKSTLNCYLKNVLATVPPYR